MTSTGFAEWRARFGWSKAEAARRLGLSRNSVIDYEAGKIRIPRYVELACEALATESRSEQEGKP